MVGRSHARPARTVLVHGATGGVGVAALQMAKSAGMVVIGTAGSDAGAATIAPFCAAVLRHRKMPHEVRKGSGTFNPLADTIKLLTMHVSKGLEFPVVAVSGVGQMPEEGLDEAEEARLFYVAATRATQRLIIPLSGAGKFADRLAGLSA